MTTGCSERPGDQVREAACRRTAHARRLYPRHNQNLTCGPTVVLDDQADLV
jgi:hypothetical protein